MQRARFSILAGFLCSFAVAACSDTGTGVKSVPQGGKSAIVAPSGTLDQNIVAILALFPQGLANAATTRWDNVKRKYAAGLSDPSQMTVAKQMLFELSDWVNQKTPEMDAPPNDEPRTGAAARAILYMSMYVYSGPETSPPPFTPSADVVVGLVTPGAPATIVTPTKHAGVQLEAGSVAENTIVVITQNPTPYPANCSGPLQTRLCQYPQFYTFDEFPHKRLLKPAKFNVCHVNTGENRYPLADHDRFRLAHAKPADPADYTPGSTIRDQNGESVELLPLIAQTFSTCVGNFYAKNTMTGAPLGLFSRFARGIEKIVTPRTAYAIDLGLGGSSVDFSPFNDVDPLGLPDLAVQSMSVAPTSVLPGAHVTLSYAAKNVGTATGAPVPATIFLTPPAVEGPPPIAQQIGSITIPSLVPGATDTRTDVVVAIPQPLPPGTYQISLVIGSDPAFPDADLTNNSASAVVTIKSGVEFSIAASPPDKFFAGAAFDGTNYLVAVQSHDAQGKATVEAQFVSTSGALGSHVVISGRSGDPASIAFDGTNYLMVWADYTSTQNASIVGQFVSPSGTLVGGVFTIGSAMTTFAGVTGLVYGGGTYFVTFVRRTGDGTEGSQNFQNTTFGRTVSPSGILGTGLILSSGLTGAGLYDVDFDGTNFFTVYTDASSVKGRFVSAAGVLGSEVTIVPASTPGFEQAIGVAFNGTNYLVTMPRRESTTGRVDDALAQLVNVAGVPVGGLIGIATDPGIDEFPVKVIASGSNFIVSYMENLPVVGATQIRARFVSGTGSLLGAAPLIIAVPTGGKVPVGAVFHFNGSTYFTLIERGVQPVTISESDDPSLWTQKDLDGALLTIPPP